MHGFISNTHPHKVAKWYTISKFMGTIYTTARHTTLLSPQPYMTAQVTKHKSPKEF